MTATRWKDHDKQLVAEVLPRHGTAQSACDELTQRLGWRVKADCLNDQLARWRMGTAIDWLGRMVPRDWMRPAVPPPPPEPETLPELPETEEEEEPPKPPPRIHQPETGRNVVRVIVPDSHGAHIDEDAAAAFLADLKELAPDQIVYLGDHLDCGGTFSTHQRTYTNEMAESYEDDVRAAYRFLDAVQRAAPAAEGHSLEGNHEGHVERWAARNMQSQRDAEALLDRQGPAAVLELERRGIRYYRRSRHYDEISIPGAMRLGKCYFVHGISHSKNAASVHLARFGASVVFGHIHRSQSTIERTVTSDGIGAWCPGTLARLQPLYRHTAPSDWSHGYGVQFVARSGKFLHVNVQILGGQSLLMDVARRLA